MSLNKCRAIVIRTVNYSESSVVLKCFTDTHGMQSYMVNGVRSKKGTIRPSHLMPLNLLELEVNHQENKSLQRIKELRCEPALRSLHFDMTKNAIGTFVCEVIYRSVKEEHHADENMFSFLFHAIQILDLERERMVNFPVYFMLQFTKYLGFYPKGKYSQDQNGFELREACFEAYHSGNPFQVDPVLSEKISLLLHADFEGVSQIPVTHSQRSALLDHLIRFYREHIPGFSDLRSHTILKEVLA